MAKTLILPFWIGDQVTVGGNLGRISHIQTGPDERQQYYVTSAEAAPAWFPVEQLNGGDLPAATVLTPFDYFKLFTAAEQLAIFGSDIPQVRQAVAFALAAPSIDLTDPTVIGALDGFVALQLMTADRAARVKTGQSPLPV